MWTREKRKNKNGKENKTRNEKLLIYEITKKLHVDIPERDRNAFDERKFSFSRRCKWKKSRSHEFVNRRKEEQKEKDNFYTTHFFCVGCICHFRHPNFPLELHFLCILHFFFSLLSFFFWLRFSLPVRVRKMPDKRSQWNWKAFSRNNMHYFVFSHRFDCNHRQFIIDFYWIVILIRNENFVWFQMHDKNHFRDSFISMISFLFFLSNFPFWKLKKMKWNVNWIVSTGWNDWQQRVRLYSSRRSRRGCWTFGTKFGD